MKKSIIFFVLVIAVYSLTGCAANHTPKSAMSSGSLGATSAITPANKVVTFDVIGKGIEPENSLTKGQAVLMAERAAVADGYRQFVEKIQGVYVEAHMKSGYGTVNWDVVKTSTRSWLRGVEIIEIKQGPYGIIEAHMQLRINFEKNGLIWWPAGIDSNISAS